MSLQNISLLGKLGYIRYLVGFSGYIRYTVRVIVDIPMGLNKELKRRFTVIQPLNLNDNAQLKVGCIAFWTFSCVAFDIIGFSIQSLFFLHLNRSRLFWRVLKLITLVHYSAVFEYTKNRTRIHLK